MTYLLSIYEIDRQYGGPEEGGWWYNTGELQRTIRTFGDKKAANAAAERCNRLLYLIQKGRRCVGSILYSGGRYAAQVHESIAPAHYPTERPRYE